MLFVSVDSAERLVDTGAPNGGVTSDRCSVRVYPLTWRNSSFIRLGNMCILLERKSDPSKVWKVVLSDAHPRSGNGTLHDKVSLANSAVGIISGS